MRFKANCFSLVSRGRQKGRIIAPLAQECPCFKRMLEPWGPVIDFDKQREIADLVDESFKLKKQSENLLEVGKTAVEMAMEQDEETAMEYIKTETE